MFGHVTQQRNTLLAFAARRVFKISRDYHVNLRVSMPKKRKQCGKSVIAVLRPDQCILYDDGDDEVIGTASISKVAAADLFHAQGHTGPFSVGVINGAIGDATLAGMETECKETVTLDIRLFKNPPAAAPVTLILALCRTKVFGRVLETATAMGVKRIHVVHTARVEPMYWESHSTKPEFVESRLLAGLEQAADTVMPQLTFWRDSDTFFSTTLKDLADGCRMNVVAHPDDAAQECPTAVSEPCNLLIGPEGGFLDAEVDRVKACGFVPLSLGPRILPVEVAVHVLLGKLCF
eukprot:m.468866 g.468866  ORF g.468866 m.468866 type:complete len:292 (-) comp21648_c0_seq9:372-1247(-)